MSKHRTHRTWRNRLLSGVLSLALALGLLPPAGLIQTAEAAYWADPYGEQLVEWGVMKPSSDLRLGDTTTRAEFAAMLNRSFGYSRLGDMPFTDVKSTDWYWGDISIAYNAGYFNGTSGSKASPTATLTREEAAVMLARCMRLQETVGEGLEFTDSRELSDWGRGLVGAAAAEGVINGLPDGSFSPQNSITRGEVAAMLVRAVGNPIGEAGEYELGEVYGNVTISSSDVTLRDTVILGNLYLTGGVDLGNVLLENVTVLGRIVISGGGESHEGRSSIVLRNVEADELAVDSMVNQFVTVSAYGLTDIPLTNVRSDTYLEDSCVDGYGLHHIELVGQSGTLLQLASNSSSGIKEVVNKTPLSLLQLVRGTAEKITIDEYATGSELLVDIDTVVKELNLDVATRVYGKGDIINLVIGANGCEIEILPEHVEVRPGLTATLVDEDGNERTIGSTDAAELSSEPRLLSGYPSVSHNLRPTSAEGLFAGNKPGTIYWAISAIADGSVSRDHLINNPPYGGNILKDGDTPQSGSIGATARTEYARQVTGLEPYGSYYISAVLVDERNNYSPLKVYSFTTPDDTVPAFTDGPRMTKVSCEVAQVTAMTNKSCTLYWVLLKAGATAPTVQNFKSGSFGGNYGSGSISVVRNVPFSIQVNTARLQEKTDYDLYLWLSDTDGILSSEVIKVVNEDTKKPEDPSFRTPDETPPTVSVRQADPVVADAASFSFEINEAPSTLYWAVVKASDNNFITASMTEQRKRSKVLGTESIAHGSSDTANAGQEVTVAVSGLRYSEYTTHNFRLYYVAKDDAGNFSEVRSILIYTLDTERPTVSISFSSDRYSTPEDQAAGRNPRPLSNTDITLTFSEQVKGIDGDIVDNFLELYSEVDRYVKQGLKETDQALKTAKDNLGQALEKYIELYYEPDSKSDPIKMGPEGTVDGDEQFGWLNLREATLKLNTDDGTVELTLASGKAVKLGGGMSYHFRFQEIFDEGYTPNRLIVMRDGKENREGNMDSFTTIFAQVWLRFMGDNVENNVVIEEGEEPEYVRMDIIIDMIPEAMSSTAEEAYWDMIMWCDTLVKFEIYRKDDGTWKKISDEITYSPTLLNGAGVSWNVQLGIDRDPNQVGGTLDQNATYGIHITSVNNAGEENREEELDRWGERVTMWFSLIAGPTATQLRSVSTTTKTSFNSERRLTASGSVVEIGADWDHESETVLEAYQQFTDTVPPAFYSTYPTFDPKSSSVIMTVMMEGGRTGRLFYVAAPVIDGEPSLPTKTGGGIPINSDNDRNGKNDDPTKDAAYQEDKTYIPTNGADRIANEDYIDYKKGEHKGDADPPIEMIINPEHSIPDGLNSGYMWEDPIEVSGGRQEITIKGLKPNTKYYIYIVLQGNGDNSVSEAVEIYQVTTNPATPPVIELSHYGSTGVSMEVNEPLTSTSTGTVRYDNPDLYYALTRKDDLPDFFNYMYVWGDTLKNTDADTTQSINPNSPISNVGPYDPNAEDYKTKTDTLAKNNNFMSVLDALINTYGSSGKTYFDEFASQELRDEVRQYVTKASKYDSYGSTTRYFGPLLGVNELPEKDKELVSYLVLQGEYVVLACAKQHDYSATDAANYGFAAIKGLYRPDPEPPKFTGVEGEFILQYSIVYDQRGKDVTETWGSLTGTNPGQCSFTGWKSMNQTITISFDKPIYTYSGSVLKQIIFGDTDRSHINIDEVLGGTARSAFTCVESNEDNTSFTFSYVKWGHGQYITLGNLFNSTGNEDYKSPYTLTISLNATKTAKEVYGSAMEDLENGSFLDIFVPVYNVTWK